MSRRMMLVCLMMAMPSLAGTEVCTPKPQKISLPTKPIAVPFTAGEKCTYAIKYEFVVGGEATLEIHEGPLINCRRTFQITSMAKSNSFVDSFFTVRDFNSTVVDRDVLNSYSFHQNLHEGGYKVIRTTTHDYVTGKFTYVREKNGNKSVKDGDLPGPIFDILSAFYYTRTLPLELGQEYQIRVFSDGDSYDLKVKVHPKFEDITVEAGRFECIKIEPKVIGDAIFKARDGQMYIWLTSDDRRLPVLIRSKVAIGSFDAELRRFDTPKNDMVNEKVPS